MPRPRSLRSFARFLGLGLAVLSSGRIPAAEPSFPVAIRVEADRPMGPLKPIWRFFGADEPNYSTAPDGRKLLAELGELRPKEVYFRTHNLLTSGDGTPALKWGSTGVYGEDGQGRPIYDWTIVDAILESGLRRGVRPYVQIGFMPEALSVRPHPYRHHWKPGAKYEEIYTGWAFPPKDYGRWEELVYQWARHNVSKHGAHEVGQWYWETWNEPNIGYWRGTREEFLRLHDHAVNGVRRALPTARVGGPDVAGGPGGTFLAEFLAHCIRGTNLATGKVGTPLDFVSFHAKGAPVTTNGHVRMGLANHLRDIDRGFAVVASFPEVRSKPIVIGESDPEGCAACQGPQLAYRNGTMYSSYTAASFPRKLDLADRHGVNLEGALTWAFEFEDQPLFAGFRSLASGGLDKPVLNTFRMFSRMSGSRLRTESSSAVPLDRLLKEGVRKEPDVSVFASRDGNRFHALFWHYHDDDVPGPDAEVTATWSGIGLPGVPVLRHHHRIDEEHGNAYAAWLRMGSPAKPTRDQYASLEKSGRLTEMPLPDGIVREGDRVVLRMNLPRQAVSLVEFELRPAR